MAEENQVTKESQGEVMQPPSGAQPVQQIMKEPQRVTTKNPKKIEAGKRLAESNAGLVFTCNFILITVPYISSNRTTCLRSCSKEDFQLVNISIANISCGI